jgi:hypothetical protein
MYLGHELLVRPLGVAEIVVMEGSASAEGTNWRSAKASATWWSTSGVAAPAGGRRGWVRSAVSSAAHSLRLERYEAGATDEAVVMPRPVALRRMGSVTSSQAASDTGMRRRAVNVRRSRRS